METLNNVNEAQVDSLVAGEGVGEIKSQFLMPVDEDATLDGGDAEACRVRFKTLRASDNVPYGLDTGALLMADEEAIKSMADLDFSSRRMLWRWMWISMQAQTSIRRNTMGLSRFILMP